MKEGKAEEHFFLCAFRSVHADVVRYTQELTSAHVSGTTQRGELGNSCDRQ